MCSHHPKVLPVVYQVLGINVGEALPQYTSIGCYTIVYYTKQSEAVCGKCATVWDNEYNPITLCGIYEEGPTLECEECGCQIESSYGDPNSPDDE